MQQCPICKTGILKPGLTTANLSRGATVVVLKGVPADVCDNCGEYYLAEKETQQVLASAKQAADTGTEVTVKRFAALAA